MNEIIDRFGESVGFSFRIGRKWPLPLLEAVLLPLLVVVHFRSIIWKSKRIARKFFGKWIFTGWPKVPNNFNTIASGCGNIYIPKKFLIQLKEPCKCLLPVISVNLMGITIRLTEIQHYGTVAIASGRLGQFNCNSVNLISFTIRFIEFGQFMNITSLLPLLVVVCIYVIAIRSIWWVLPSDWLNSTLLHCCHC